VPGNQNIDQLWETALTKIKGELTKPSFETWFKSTEALAIQEGSFLIEVPNEFAQDWLETRYSKLVHKTLTEITDNSYEIKFITPEMKEKEILTTPQEENKKKKRESSPQQQGDLIQTSKQDLNPKYTFDTFVIGNSNRFAHAASLAVAEAPAKAYNPLFIYGEVGLGKTHLMHAIGRYILEHNSNMQVMYLTSEEFTNQLINSIKDDSTVDFRNQYRNIDILLVDDIQFLAGKERTQEEFFHTFNALHEANKQIVISSDRPPKEIPTLEERLRSRFQWGLITDIQEPDLETRIAILKKKAALEGLEVPNEVVVHIANKIKSNIRELEGALIRVIAYSSFTNKQITVELAEEVLHNITTQTNGQNQSESGEVNVELIKQIVADYYDLELASMESKKRTQAIAFPRQIAMYLARELTDSSLPKIGDKFGGRDHSTVLHAYNKIEDKVNSEPEFKTTIQQLKEKINQ